MSPPAENASPAPVRTSARTSGSAPELGEHERQLPEERGGHGVLLLGPVHPDHGHGISALDAENLELDHVPPSRRLSRKTSLTVERLVEKYSGALQADPARRRHGRSCGTAGRSGSAACSCAGSRLRSSRPSRARAGATSASTRSSPRSTSTCSSPAEPWRRCTPGTSASSSSASRPRSGGPSQPVRSRPSSTASSSSSPGCGLRSPGSRSCRRAGRADRISSPSSGCRTSPARTRASS